MKRVLLLTTIGVMFCVAFSQAQNVFDPNDPIVRWNSGAALGTAANPNPNISGLQKWVSVASSGVSTGSGRFDASSYKAYFINFQNTWMPFRIKFPRSYTNPDSANKHYPAMIFMHGAGEPGCPSNGGVYQNERQLLHGGNLFRQRVDNNEFDGFLIYPQVLAGSNCWSDWGTPFGNPPTSNNFDAIFAMIDSMFKYVRLDRDRILLTGLSNGGAADWNMTAFYPQWVAKNAPSAAATGANNYADFVHIPIWFASGGKDTNPNPGFANGTYTSIQNAGGDILYTLFPDLGHSVWYQHWQLPGFVEWMNDIHKANPLVYFQRNEFCPSEAIDARLGISPGFYQYEWQKDGVTIAFATANSISPSISGMNYVRPYQKYTNYSYTQVNGGVVASFTGNTITVKQAGTYRVRFKRKSTDTEWSAWSPKPAVIGTKALTQTPPITINFNDGLRSNVLPAPDGSTTVPLQLPEGFTSYEWYRNDAQVGTGRFLNAIPGVYKAKANEEFGCGSLFSATFNVVAANGEPKPDPATNLTATIEDQINVRLNWNQNPNAGTNETGFEIYKSTGGSGGPYKLLAITPPDVTTYLDENQASDKDYYYIVRAVGDFGAAANTNEATAHTPADVIAPTAPSNLEAVCITREKVTLKWNASTDNVNVAVYDIYINGQKAYSTPNTRFEIYQLTPLSQYAFTVKAKDAAGNASQPSNQVAAYTRQQGVCYKVFEGDWDELPDFNTMLPVKEGMSATIDLSVRPAGLNERFGFLWEGHISRTSTSGTNTHQFQICSDDGSRFYWGYYNPQSNGNVNNDGLHGDQCVSSGNFSLGSRNSNAYPFALAFFEKTGGEAMRLNWRQGTSGSWSAMPATAFNVGSTPNEIPAIPTNLSASAVSSSQINLGWTDASNNETGFEIVRGTAAAGPFLPLATVGAGTTSFQDTGLNASTQYWYRLRSVNLAGQSDYTNAQSATTQAPPPPPAAPTNLTASSPALQTVQLQWNDNSNNETAFEVWRSIGNNTEFTLLATVPGGAGAQKVYVDAPVFANVHYFYQVRAVGAPTPSAYTNIANASTANSAPVINTVPDFTVRQGSSVTIPISATDMDSDPLTFNVPNLPYYAQIQNVSNGNANLIVSPPEGEQGGFTLRAIVDDGFGGKDTARFTIVVNDNSLPVLNPISDLNINEGDSVTIALTATDAEMNQYMVWSFQNKPSWATFTNNGNGTGSLKLKPGYAASGLYNMTVIVDDGFGAWTSRSFNIVVNEVDPNETIQINFRYFTGFQPLWNDVQIVNGGTFNVNNLINKKNQNSGAGIRYLSGGPASGSDIGMQPGGLGVFPDAIMKDVLQVGHNGGARNATIQLYGLDPNKKYNLVFFASVNSQLATAEPWRNYNANTRTIYRVGSASAEVRVLGNTNNTDTIYQVQPNASGQITFTMEGNDENPGVGAMLNAMVVDAQFDDGTTPAKPTNLQAQVIPNLGVRLTWNDISYNENSYKIFRSNDRNGPYTELTPGALKDSINYVDPTVAPYTQYFYYVRGINHLGLGQSSDTASAVTGNNKPEISGLTNLFVKTGNSVQDDFTVTDNASDIVTVTVLNKPSFVSLTSLGGGTYRITANPTVDHVGFHYLTIEARDNNGGLATQQISLTVADANTRSVYINFAYNIPAPAPWNNVIGYGNLNTTLNNLRDENNQVTSFGINLVDGWDDVTKWGQRTGNNSGVFPDSVLAGGIADYGTTDLRVRFAGLDPDMRYNLVFTGSFNEGRDATTRFYVNGGPADTLSPRNNTNSTANLNGLTPAANGEIIVNIVRLTGNYVVLSGVQIEEFSPAITLMPPNNLYVEGRTNNTSVALTWSDRASNEIRYEVQRSTTEDFSIGNSSTLLPPGSSSLINSGVAQGLQPNTKYWFRVRAQGPGTDNFSAWSNKVAYITPVSVVSVNFNFSVANGPSPWNNLEALPNFTGTWSSLLNQSNQPSGMTLAIEKIFNGEYAFGIRTGNNSGVVPDNVMQASYWIDKAQVATVRLSGLNQSMRYRIGFTGGIDNSIFPGNMTGTYTVNGRSVYLNSMYNTTKMVWIGDIQPDANGEVLLEFSTPNDDEIVYAFTSAIIVQGYNDAQGGTMVNGIVQPTPAPGVVTNQTGEERLVPDVAAELSSVETRMYPNPFNDQINVEFNNSSATNQLSVDVYDMMGRVVYRRNFGSIPAGATVLKLNTAESRLNTGVYMVTLKVNGLPVQSTKMIKDRK